MKTYEVGIRADVEITAREFNKRHEWCLNAAYKLATEALTDANGHQECRYLTHGEELADSLRQLLERSHNIDQSFTHDGLLNCEAIARAREALRKIERP